MTLRRTAMKRSTVRGSGIPADVRQAVLQRDEGICQRCGAWCANVPSSVHHRLPRRSGGRSGLALIASYDMANLVLVCGDGVRLCHGDIERQRDLARDDGWLLYEIEDPAAVPVLTYRGWLYPGTQWTEEKP